MVGASKARRGEEGGRFISTPSEYRCVVAEFVCENKRLTTIYPAPLPSLLSSQQCQRRPTPAPLRIPLRAVRTLVGDASSQSGTPAILGIEAPHGAAVRVGAWKGASDGNCYVVLFNLLLGSFSLNPFPVQAREGDRDRISKCSSTSYSARRTFRVVPYSAKNVY